MAETEVKTCREELLTLGKVDYNPTEFGEVAVRLGYLSESEVGRILKAIERLKRDQDSDDQVIYKAIYIPGYEILDKIGDGAIGTVFKALQITMKRVVALKVLHKRWLTDEEFKWMTKTLLSLEVGRDRHTVYMKPEIVVEVAFNEIQRSRHYDSGFALRFARIKRIRSDKSPSEIDTIERIRDLYEEQFRSKGKL